MENKHYAGLSKQQVKESREKHGVNLLTPPTQVPLWKLFLENLKILLSGSCWLQQLFP